MCLTGKKIFAHCHQPTSKIVNLVIMITANQCMHLNRHWNIVERVIKHNNPNPTPMQRIFVGFIIENNSFFNLLRIIVC